MHKKYLFLTVALAVMWSIGFSYAYLFIPNFVPPVDYITYVESVKAAQAGVNIFLHVVHGPLLAPEGMPFVYPPAVLVPLTFFAFLPIHLGYMVWTVITSLCLVYLLFRALDPKHVRWLPLLFLVFCFTNVMMHHYIFGQINIILATLILFDLLSKKRMRGFLVGIAAGIKLTPGIFLIYLALTRQYKQFFWAVGGFFSTVLLGFLAYPQLSKQYFTDSIFHLSNKVDLGRLFASSGNNSFAGAGAALGISYPYVLGFTICVAGIGLWCSVILHKHNEELLALTVIGILACFISPVSWIHHWVWLIPATVVLLQRRKKIALVLMGLMLCQVTDRGESLLMANPASWLVPIGWILREGLILSGMLIIISLLWEYKFRFLIPRFMSEYKQV